MPTIELLKKTVLVFLSFCQNKVFWNKTEQSAFSRKLFRSVLHLFFPLILPACAQQCCDSLAYICTVYSVIFLGGKDCDFQKDQPFCNLYLYLIHLYPSP